ncbi:MAG: sporulation integral membrane protein YtvI [Oscillospiraceae bacterium]|nr:sporulation integral membrane protein YtvI [Oscillospiraceae bacterium]
MELTEKRNTIINIAFYALIIAAAFFGFKYLLPFFLPFIIGFSIAMVLKPVSDYLCRKTSIPRQIGSISVTALFFIFISLLCFFLGERIIKEGSDLLKKLPSVYTEIISPLIENFINSLADTLEPYVNHEIFFKNFYAAMDSFSEKLTNFTADFITIFIRAFPSFVISVVFAVISAFFFSSDYYKTTSFLSKLIPVRHRNKLFEAKKLCGTTVKNMVKGYFIILIITFIELYIGLSLFRVENALVLSMLVSALDILPVIGSGTFLIPFSIISLIYGRISLGIGIIILYLIITVIRNIIEPKIIGKHIGLSPIVMLISVYVGAKIGGILGILFLPVLVTVLKEAFTSRLQS